MTDCTHEDIVMMKDGRWDKQMEKKRKCIFVTLFTSMTTLHDCLFCKPLVEDKGARDTKNIYKIN